MRGPFTFSVFVLGVVACGGVSTPPAVSRPASAAPAVLFRALTDGHPLAQTAIAIHADDTVPCEIPPCGNREWRARAVTDGGGAFSVPTSDLYRTVTFDVEGYPTLQIHDFTAAPAVNDLEFGLPSGSPRLIRWLEQRP
jgi:hypothetical protein